MNCLPIIAVVFVFCGGVLSKGGSKSKGAAGGGATMDFNQYRHNGKNWVIYGPIMIAAFLIISCVLSCRLRNWYRRKTYKKTLVADLEKVGSRDRSPLESRDRSPLESRDRSPLECSTIPSEYQPSVGTNDYRLLVVNDSGCGVSHTTTLTKDERM